MCAVGKAYELRNKLETDITSQRYTVGDIEIGEKITISVYDHKINEKLIFEFTH